MRLKTTIKLFFQNLGLVWSITLFKLISYTLILALLSFCAMPLILKLNESGFFKLFAELLDVNKFTFAELGVNIANLTKEFINVINANWANLQVSIIMFFVIATFVNYFINSMADIATTEVLYGSMSCNAKFAFSACFVSNFFTCLKYALVKSISSLIVDAVIICSVIGFIMLTVKYSFIALFSVLIAIILIILLFSFRITLFSCFAPTVVAKGYGVLKGLFKSLEFSFKNFWANFATALALIIIILCLNGFVILFTFTTGAIITIPSSYVLIALFNMVIFYSNSGMFFYINQNNIIDNSKGVKRIEQQDTMNDIKNLI